MAIASMELDSRSRNVEQPMTDLHKEDCIVLVYDHFYRESFLPETNVVMVTHGHS